MSSHGHDHAPSHAPKELSGGGKESVLVEGAFGGVIAMFMGLVCMGVQNII